MAGLRCEDCRGTGWIEVYSGGRQPCAECFGHGHIVSSEHPSWGLSAIVWVIVIGIVAGAMYIFSKL